MRGPTAGRRHPFQLSPTSSSSAMVSLCDVGFVSFRRRSSVFFTVTFMIVIVIDIVISVVIVIIVIIVIIVLVIVR